MDPGGLGRAQLRPLRQPGFDALFARAGRAHDVADARKLYREAMDTLNADAPAIFLYAPANQAVVSRRMEGVEIDPYSWASGLRSWVAGAQSSRVDN